MAFLQLKSNNENFSHILSKNPGSGLLVKSLRKGKLFGWYTDNQAYNIYFKDAEAEVSYKSHPDEEFEYQNHSRYNSPTVYNNAIKELFHTTTRSQSELDVADTYEHSLTIGMVFMKRSYFIEHFARHFKELEIESKEVANKNYQLVFKTKRSIFHLLNCVTLFTIFISLANDEYMVVTDEIMEKYFNILNRVDAPYFIRYLLKVKLVRSERMFEKYKHLLETSSSSKIEMKYGDTQLMRRHEIQKHLTFENKIIDLGCGGGYYVNAFAGKTKQDYIAIDINEEELKLALRRASRKQFDNVKGFKSIDEFLKSETFSSDESYDVILSEVIEHMELDQAKELVDVVLSIPGLNSLIITSPNADFNQFYQFEEDETRHDDHKFELDAATFLNWIGKIVDQHENPFEMEMLWIGDRVNNFCPTIGTVIKKSTQEEVVTNETLETISLN